MWTFVRFRGFYYIYTYSYTSLFCKKNVMHLHISHIIFFISFSLHTCIFSMGRLGVKYKRNTYIVPLKGRILMRSRALYNCRFFNCLLSFLATWKKIFVYLFCLKKRRWCISLFFLPCILHSTHKSFLLSLSGLWCNIGLMSMVGAFILRISNPMIKLEF